MKNFIEFCKNQPSTKVLVVLVALSVLFNIYATNILNTSYTASLFPVPYYEAQLSFSPTKIQGWYSFLIEHEALSKYIQTQNLDFVFIVSTLFLHFFALLLISRLFPVSSTWRSGMIVVAIVSSLAPLADALENGVSYIMMANPLHFPAYLAYIYSTFSAIKFSMFAFAYIAFIVGLVASSILWIQRKRI